MGNHPDTCWRDNSARTQSPGDSWKELADRDAANKERCAAGPCKTNKECLVGDVKVGTALATVSMRSQNSISHKEKAGQ